MTDRSTLPRPPFHAPPEPTRTPAPVAASVPWLAPVAALAAALALAAASEARAQTDAATTADAARPGAERLQVADPYIELRTGPGRGFPVTYVAEKGAWITVDLRRTDWYRVRAPGPAGSGGEREGWVHRSQLERTLTEAGTTRTFRDTLVDDFLARRVEMGVAWGQFEGEPMLKLWGEWRLAETFGLEASYGQVQGAYSGSDFWHLALVSEPWADHRWSPFLTLGLGRFGNTPNASLVGGTPVDANLGHVGVGLRWYVAERFVARADWSHYAAFVSDTRTIEYRAFTIGFSFFF